MVSCWSKSDPYGPDVAPFGGLCQFTRPMKMMRILAGLLLPLLISGPVKVMRAQQSSAPYSFEWEVVATDSIPGMTTVRLYAKLVHPTDYLTSVSGWDEMDGRIETTTTFYQHPEGWATPNNNNPLLFVPLPELRWDSWVTIGIDVAPDGAAGEIPIGLFPPQTDYWVDEFEAGGNLVMDVDGAWFVTMGCTNGIAGDDLRVLVGQFTTDGIITGHLNLQVFSEGVASSEFMDDVHTVTIPEFDATGLSSVDSGDGEIQWGMTPIGERVVEHRVSSRVARWGLWDWQGRWLEEGRVRDGRFRSHHSGVVVLFSESGNVLSRRLIP